MPVLFQCLDCIRSAAHSVSRLRVSELTKIPRYLNCDTTSSCLPLMLIATSLLGDAASLPMTITFVLAMLIVRPSLLNMASVVLTVYCHGADESNDISI